MPRHSSFTIAVATLFPCILLSGCGQFTPESTTASSAAPVAAVSHPASISGRVHGGQQPVSGAQVYLFAASTAGYGTASTSLLNTAASGVSTDQNGNGYVATDSNGNFVFAAVPQGTYTITPSLSGTNALFTPATQKVTVGAGGAVASFKAVVGYAVTGNVSYTGPATGPINLALQFNCSGGGEGYILGTQTNAPGSFTINGAAPGSYLVKAWRDAAHNNWPSASDPTGSSAALAVSSADLTGVSVALADPAPVAFSSILPNLIAVPFDQGVVLSAGILTENYLQVPAFWSGLGNGSLELATSYTLQWSTDQTFNTNTQSKSFPATGDSGNTWVLNALNGIADGQILYFRDQGVLGGTVSPWSQVVGPVTIGAPAGTITVSGNVTFASPATGPLYVSFNNSTTHQSYYTEIANPVSPQHYSIELPADGTYYTYAFIDQNNDNILQDNGDMVQSGWVFMLAVAGSSATQDFNLEGGGSGFFDGQTSNVQYVNLNGNTKQFYDFLAVAWSGSKQLTNMELVSGPNVIVPQDFYRCEWGPEFSFCNGLNLDGNPPNVGDAYGFKLTYSDGSSEPVSKTITSLPGSFGANPTPAGLGTSLTPTFSWTDPPNASTYVYNFDGPYWSIPASGWGTFSSSIDSITWGVDPTGGSNLPSAPSLTSGEYYQWEVDATDSSNNASNLTVGYYPGYARVYLPTANPSTLGAATVGQSYTGSIVATNGTAPYTFTVTGLSDGLTYSSSGGTLTISGTPLAAGTITFQVYVIDSTNASWGPVTYTINVGN